ncbi:MAG: tRNA dihydrouridine synthase DusB [Bacteroidaceae bacterium]|nr:tRNA dihydrouridine synthase DusB [Bacteroidaceae bacterium]
MKIERNTHIIDLGSQPAMLAPMEDVTDGAFRLLCKQMGASMVFSEFVSADALIRGIDRSMQKISVSDAERPVAVQIYGRDADSMAEAAKTVEAQAHPDMIDINWGCPVKKIAGKGAGAGMLRNPELMAQITRAVVDAVKTPVTVKTRLGWDHDSKTIVDLAERLQDCGISAITIHGRTRSQMYTGQADWTLIGAVKNNPRMKIPVIGNGDIDSALRAKQCFDNYGVDGIMVGRATFGRPWIFKEIRHYLDSGQQLDCLTDEWKLDVLCRQAQESVRLSRGGELGGIMHIRRHLAASPLFKGISNFRETRIKMLRAQTLEELMDIMNYIQQHFLHEQ